MFALWANLHCKPRALDGDNRTGGIRRISTNGSKQIRKKTNKTGEQFGNSIGQFVAGSPTSAPAWEYQEGDKNADHNHGQYYRVCANPLFAHLRAWSADGLAESLYPRVVFIGEDESYGRRAVGVLLWAALYDHLPLIPLIENNCFGVMANSTGDSAGQRNGDRLPTDIDDVDGIRSPTDMQFSSRLTSWHLYRVRLCAID
jgi:hypothetical protein